MTTKRRRQRAVGRMLDAAGGAPGLHAAAACLRRSTPWLRNLSYPADAWAHYDQLHTALKPWLQTAPGFLAAAAGLPQTTHCLNEK